MSNVRDVIENAVWEYAAGEDEWAAKAADAVLTALRNAGYVVGRKVDMKAQNGLHVRHASLEDAVYGACITDGWSRLERDDFVVVRTGDPGGGEW